MNAAALGVAGSAAATTAVIAGGHAYTASSTPSTSWLRLIAPEGFDAGDSPVYGLLLFAGIAGLVLCWLVAIRAQARGRLSDREIWSVGVAWAVPLAVGPPLVSKDVYAYTAGALLQRAGLDVYRSGPSALGGLHTAGATRALTAVDPRWRHALSPYGPVATAIERAAGALGAGNPVVVLIALRVVAVVSVLAVAGLAAALAPPCRGRALVLVGLNPLLLVHALSATHFEAVMCALLLAALVSATRGRWTLALVLACAAGLVKAPGLLAVALLVAWHVTRPALRRSRTSTAAGDLGTAAAALVAMSLLVPDGWGWLRTIATPAGGSGASSFSGVVGAVLHVLLRTPAASAVTTVTAGVLACGVVLYLGITIERRPPATSLGLGLLTVALLAPITYPWYLLWGVVCILAVEPPGRRRDLLIALCSVATVVSVPGLPGTVAGALALAGLAVAVLVVAWRWRRSAGVPVLAFEVAPDG